MFASDVDDVMNAFFSGHLGGMRGVHRGAAQSRRGRDEVRALSVTLEDLYTGKQLTLERSRKEICTRCKGRGVKSGASLSMLCSVCHGAGQRIMVRQMGLMVQQFRAPCDACGGSGSEVSPRDFCSHCRGEKVVQVEAPVSLEVIPGMQHGEEFRFRGMSDEHPDAVTPGDFVVVLQQTKHSIFTRKGADLIMTKRVSLGEALCGFQFTVVHLDGRVLVIRNNRGNIIKPGDVQSVVGEGMPIGKGLNKYGDLLIEFNVDYPQRLNETQITTLRECLPPPKSIDVTGAEDDVNTCYVSRESSDVLLNALKREEEDDDDDEPQVHGSSSPQGCEQQ